MRKKSKSLINYYKVNKVFIKKKKRINNRLYFYHYNIRSLNFFFFKKKINFYINFLEIQDDLKNFNNLKFYKKYYFNSLHKLISKFIKSGLKIKNTNNVLKSISNIYNIINDDLYSDLLISSDDKLIQFNIYKKNNKNFKNLNTLVNWLINLNKPVFDLKCNNVDKKYKKIIKGGRLFKILYIPNKLRFKTSIKHIVNTINSDQNLKFNKRVINNISDIFFNYKNSKLYLRKLYIYNRVFKLN